MTAVSKHSLVNPRARHGFQLRSCSITAVASYLPERVLTNADVGRRIGDNGEWILQSTGIRERRIAAGNEFTSDLAGQAALRALHKANLCAKDLDLILVATNTPDMLFPATACVVQAKIGARHCPALDLKAGGAGFRYALEIGGQFIASRTFDTVLVVGAEKLSTILEWGDRDTCVLFGDGAGAVILQHRPRSAELLVSSLGSDGTKGDLLSNQRIIDAFAKRVGATPGQVFVNLEKCGSTSAASVPIALAEAVETERVKSGDFVLLVAFGSGFTWGATIIQW